VLTNLKKLTTDKQSSLFWAENSDGEKVFCNIQTWTSCQQWN